jgi:hypothetical protein
MITAKTAILSHIMSRRTWYRTQTLLLAISLGLGMSLCFVQGSVMAAEMAVAADGAHHGPSGCDGCGGTDHEGMDACTCLAVCGSATQGVVPGELLTLPSVSRTDIEITRLRLSGQFHSPDHGPPKILALADA